MFQLIATNLCLQSECSCTFEHRVKLCRRCDEDIVTHVFVAKRKVDVWFRGVVTSVSCVSLVVVVTCEVRMPPTQVKHGAVDRVYNMTAASSWFCSVVSSMQIVLSVRMGAERIKRFVSKFSVSDLCSSFDCFATSSLHNSLVGFFLSVYLQPNCCCCETFQLSTLLSLWS